MDLSHEENTEDASEAEWRA